MFVRAHKLVIGARPSNDGCYVTSRNRLNGPQAILFMSDHLQEFTMAIGGHFDPYFDPIWGVKIASKRRCELL